jgi:hypothetical protein
MRAPSSADAADAKDAGEFPETPVYAAGSAEGCARSRVRANGVSQKRRDVDSTPPLDADTSDA